MHVRKKLSRQDTNKQQEKKALRGLEEFWKGLDKSGKIWKGLKIWKCVEGRGDVWRALRSGYEEVWRGLEEVWHDLDISGGILESWRADIGLLLFPGTSTSRECWRNMDMNFDIEVCTAETRNVPKQPPNKTIPNFHY